MTTTALDAETQVATFRDCFGHLRAEIGRVFVGQPALVEQLLICFFCQGHALLEGPPGLGKTLLVRSLSEAVSLRFGRIQCTPDLMPADVTGTNVLVDSGPHREFRFQPGPIFAHVILADEINRATPRTQAAFLEAMQERSVTVFGISHPLEAPFSVFATQNPVEMEGTYPLPEAQLDRFFFKLEVHAPSMDELQEILARTTAEPPAPIVPRFGAAVVRAALPLIRQVKVADEVTGLVLRVIRATHPDEPGAPAEVRQYVRYGASPRGAQAIILAAKTLALLNGRFHVSVDDISRVVRPALRHRLILNFSAQVDRVATDALLDHAVAAAARDADR